MLFSVTGVHPPNSYDANFPITSPAITPISAPTRFLTEVWGYHPGVNLGAKYASQWVLEHFRHKPKHINWTCNRFNALIFPQHKKESSVAPQLLRFHPSPRISKTHFALPGVPSDVQSWNNIYKIPTEIFRYNSGGRRRHDSKLFTTTIPTGYQQMAKAKAYNTCRVPQAATATSEALVMSQAKLA